MIETMDRQAAEEYAEIRKIIKEGVEYSRQSERMLTEQLNALAEQSEETKRILAEHVERAERQRAEYYEKWEKIDLWMKESNRRLESFGFVQGEIAEDLFIRTVKDAMRRQNILIDKVHPYLESEGAGEYDIVAVNRTDVFVFEIKNKLRVNHLEKFRKVQLPRFKDIFPQYADHTLYGGVGALVVKKQLEEQARSLGLYVLTQGGDGNSVLYPPPTPEHSNPAPAQSAEAPQEPQSKALPSSRVY